MVSDQTRSTRLDSQLVAPWPQAIDIENDIFMPGTVATFKSQLMRALISRNLYSVISEKAPTMLDIASDNPDASPNEVLIAFENCIAARHDKERHVATLLPAVVKTSSLTYADRNLLDVLVATCEGLQVYEWIMARLDLRRGKVQDKLRHKFTATTVNATMSVAAIGAAVDLKWFLFKHHTLYDASSEHGTREGIREILQMLLKAPGNIGTEAMLQLANVESMDVSAGGDKWIEDRQESYKRYGQLLIGANHSEEAPNTHAQETQH